MKSFSVSTLKVLGASGALGLVVSLAQCAGGTPRDLDELAAALGDAAGVVVHGDDIRWEPSRGASSDVDGGRFVLFLGAEKDGAPHDVYRGRVRLSPEGRPLGVVGVRNLTATPLGDDHALVVNGTHAAYATYAYGQEQSVTVLDLEGEGAQYAGVSTADRAMAWVTNIQQTGDGAGIARWAVTFDNAPEKAGLALSETALDIDLLEAGAVHRVRVDLAKGESQGGHIEPSKHLPKKLSHWAVDTARAVPWIGPAPIAWLEEKTFALRDTVRQLAFKAKGGGDALAVTEKEPPPSVLDPSQASADLGHWPPPAIRSIWKTPEPGEGEWTEPKQTWVKKLPAAPSAFYEAFVRPDEDRPYAKVLFVAMDMRQLDLDMEAGSEDPKPLTGPPGSGRFPREPQSFQRIAAAFNGGFKTEHGAYGMMLHKRVLLPPMQGVATVVMTKDNHVGMGTWGMNKDIGGIVDVESADIVSYRQNLDPLVDSDKVNPLGRTQWGFTLPGTGMQTERSGICINNAGHLLYAWGDDVSAISLGKAMKMAGCIYGMHLDMNPYHTGFLFTDVKDLKNKGYKSELLTTKMEISTDRYITYAPKDFFFVMMHDPQPPSIEGVSWEADPGVQPAPAWMPGLWHGKGDADLLEIEPGRASFRVRAGKDENGPHELADDDAHRVLFALGMGASKRRGLVIDGKTIAASSGIEARAMLITAEDGALSIGSAAGAHGDAIELPLVVDEGKPTSHRAKSALGITAAGRVYIARNGDVASALVKAGCTKAVAIEGAVARAGTSTPPRSRYDDTTLYAMGKALAPRGFRFEAQHPYEVPKKK